MSKTEELNRLIWGALAAFGVFQMWFALDFLPLDGGSRLSLGLGQTLAEQFRYIVNGTSHSFLPPGYPLLLAVFELVGFGGPLFYFGLNILLGTLALIFCFEFIKQLENQFIAVVSVFLLVTSPVYSDAISAELSPDFSFFFLFSLVLFLSDKLVSRSPRERTLSKIVLLFAIPLAVCFRLAGVALALGALADALEKPHPLVKDTSYRLYLFWAAVFGTVFFVFWIIRNLALYEAEWQGQSAFSYWQTFVQVGFFGYLAHLWDAPFAQGVHFSTLTFRIEGLRVLWYSPFAILPLVCMLSGLWQFFRAERLIVGAVGGYLLILFLWPEASDPKMLIPVYPFLVLYSVRGAAYLVGELVKLGRSGALVSFALGGFFFLGSLFTRLFLQVTKEPQDSYYILFWLGLSLLATYWIWKRGKVPRVLARFSETIQAGELPKSIGVIAAGLFMLLFGSGVVLQSDKAAIRADLNYAELSIIEVGEWLAQNTKEDTVIMAGTPITFNSLSNRKVKDYPVLSDVDELLNSIVKSKASYLIVDDERLHPEPSEFSRHSQLVSRYPSLLTLSFESNNLAVYRVNAASAD